MPLSLSQAWLSTSSGPASGRESKDEERVKVREAGELRSYPSRTITLSLIWAFFALEERPDEVGLAPDQLDLHPTFELATVSYFAKVAQQMLVEGKG